MDIDSVYASMIKTRPHKFKAWVKMLRGFRILASTPLFNDPKTAKLRSEFLGSMYASMRLLDDYGDRDAIPPGDADPTSYIEDKIAFLDSPTHPSDSIETLLNNTLELADQLDFTIVEECRSIMGSILFDSKRYGTLQPFSEDVLLNHFHDLDIIGTVKGSLKLYAEDPSTYHSLIPLGKASRHYYDIRDLPEDIFKGFLNIPAESLEEYRITKTDLKKAQLHAGAYMDLIEGSDDVRLYHDLYLKHLAPSLKDWVKDYSDKGLRYIEMHKKMKLKYSLATKLSLHLGYRIPAEIHLRRYVRN